ncbi:uroporphyrinogen-III synthase [Brevundimonas sp. NPDC092305]|uniref:uroporphyrinogen-III synthase n=1 Tax=Brevundimonas sp. NPDC092305 TaxID=3363957 RepID=UPI00382EC6DA
MSVPRRVWVTRSEPGAGRTAARLKTLGFEPVVRPLIAITTLDQPAPDLSSVAALAFTSVNGVAAFAALTPDRDLPVFTVGEVTASAARDAGFAEVRSADGDLTALARLLETSDIGGTVLAAVAREPAGDLAGMVPTVHVRTLTVYAASETGVDAPDDIDSVLLHSARSARALARLWRRDRPTPAVFALSDAVAFPMLSLTIPRVASRPTEAALLEALGKPGPDV